MIYQYYNGGPYDPLEELYSQFPDIPEEWLQEAADEIYPEGTEWVKKEEY